MDHAKVDQIIDKYQGKASSRIQVLLDIQEENGWLSKEILERVSEKLDVPLSQIQQTATFYKAFSVMPKGRHEVHVCTGTACHVNGAQRVLHEVQDLTGIKAGETDSDMKFTLKTVNCLGRCTLGPVMEIDGKTHGKMSSTGTADVLKKYE